MIKLRKNKLIYFIGVMTLLMSTVIIGNSKPTTLNPSPNLNIESLPLNSIIKYPQIPQALLPNYNVVLPSSQTKVSISSPTIVHPVTQSRNSIDPRKLAEQRAALLNQKGTKIVSAARGMIGTRYKYGGSTSRGTDCSGLVVRSMSVALKTNVPHNAASLFKKGTAVNKANLMPGDLVFFRGTRGSKGGITHVGIYSGKGNFIHASTSKGVVEESLSTKYYAARYAGGRRLHK